MQVDTETIDRLFLELSQFTTAKTNREIGYILAIRDVLRQYEAYQKDDGAVVFQLSNVEVLKRLSQ